MFGDYFVIIDWLVLMSVNWPFPVKATVFLLDF